MGKLLILPIRQTVVIEGLPDLTIDLRPGAELPPVPPGSPPPGPPPPPQPIPPPIVIPPTPAPPGSQGFTVNDISAFLPRKPENDPSPPQDYKDSLTFHWEGADVLTARTDQEVQNAMVGIAIQHIAKQWAPGVYGGGIMYHEVIAPSGNTMNMRDYTDVLWHCGANEGNLHSRAILVYCSLATPPTANQLLAINKRRNDFEVNAGHPLPAYPHSFWSPTQCPGDTIRMLLGYGGS
jgi:hypothetical protein